MKAHLLKRVIRVALLVFALSVAVLLSPTADSLYADKPLGDIVLEQVAKEQGLEPNRLRLGTLERTSFPLTGKTLYRAKVIHTKTGKVYGTVVDQNGVTQDWGQAKQAERAAYAARYGKLHPALYDQLQKMADADELTVAIWLKATNLTTSRPALAHTPAQVEKGNAPLSPPDLNSPKGTDSEQKDKAKDAQSARVAAIQVEQAGQKAAIDAARKAQSDLLKQQVASIRQPLLSHLQTSRRSPIYVSPLAPLVYVTLPKSELLKIAQRAEVDTVYGPNQNFDLMDSAKPTQKADVVNTFGFTGSGSKVAILEDSRIEFNNPYLVTGITRVPGDANVDQHATATAGMVASQHGTYRGIAPGAGLYSANATSYADANLSAAMDWAASTQAVDVINNSWGTNAGDTDLNDHDRHLDYIVRNLWPTVTVAAGNENNGCRGGTGRVTSPARGYNTISVGNYADNNTVTWSGDGMDSCSSYVNPSTGIEKPEVAAVGSDINSTTHTSPWVGNVGSGTSYAAPMVAGEAALLMSRHSSLKVYPEAVKAIVMATALHNIEGDSRLSDYDGAGGVDMRAAFRVVDEGWWDWNSVGTNSFPYSYYVYAYAGEVVRAAIAWDSNPASNYATDPLQADIDLAVYDPSGNLVTWSTSAFNSYEVVEFTAATTGNYELRVDKASFDGSTECVGAAWWPGHRVLTDYTPQTLDTPPVGRDYFRFYRGAYWNAIGIRPVSGADHDLYLYSGSAFSDPANHTQRTSSAWGTSSVDFVLVDGNHAPTGDYYPEVKNFSGTGNYAIESATWSADTVGTYGPYAMTPSQVIRVWDSNMIGGVRKYFGVKPVSGNADLGMALYASDGGISSTWYQGRSQYVAFANSAGAGGQEYMNYQTASSDYLGLVVWNNGATSNTSFYLYTDTTAPSSGSIVINSGATYATSTTVNLALSATDAETGISQMRFSNDGATWGSWGNYSTSKTWTMSSGDGTKTVYVQYMNNAGMTSSSYADTTILDATAPTGSITINSGATYATSTSATLTLAARDAGSGIGQMRFSNDGSSWSAWGAYGTSRAWTFTAGDGTKTIYVQFKDNVGNISSSYTDTIVLDTVVPNSNAFSPASTGSLSFTVSWSGTDGTSGIAAYDVQYRVGRGGAWTTWLAGAHATSAVFGPSSPRTVERDQTYYFQVRARDNAGNLEAYPGGDGDTSTYVNVQYDLYVPLITAHSALECEEALVKPKIWNGGLVWSCDATIKKVGAVSLRMEASDYSIVEMYSNLIPVQPNQRYSVAYWVKTDLQVNGADLYGKVMVAQYNANAKETDDISANRLDPGFALGQSVGGQTDWVFQSYNFTTQGTAAYARLRGALGGSVGTAKGRMWLDQVSFTRQP